MLSIMIISHGPLSKALADTAAMVLGPQEHLLAVGLYEHESPEDLKRKITEAIGSIPDSSELLIFSDIQSGTPFNTAALLSREHVFEHISGVNLPLLVEALTLRNYLSAGELKERLIASAPTTIMDVNRLLGLHPSICDYGCDQCPD